jgi:hypothetical protein
MVEWKDKTPPPAEQTAVVLLTPVSKVIVAQNGNFQFTTLSVGLWMAHDSMEAAKASAIRDLLPHVREALAEMERQIVGVTT